MNKTIKDAPKCLNTNDKAMWVLGWNECHAAQRRVLEQALEALNVMQEDVVSTPNAYEAQRQAVRAIQEVLHE